jgi:RNA polymerase sigma-70 factor (ECF subfamily)
MADAHRLGPLLARAGAGDRAALADLLEKLRPYVRLLVRPWLGPHLGRKVDDSDLIQETLLRVYQGFGAFHGREVPQLLGWVGTIAANVAATCQRQHAAGKRDLVRERPGMELLSRLHTDGSSPEARAVRDEEAARLAAALERLPDIHRDVIQARFFDQLPFAEISRQTGKSVAALRVVCLRAIRRLRHEMEAPA